MSLTDATWAEGVVPRAAGLEVGLWEVTASLTGEWPTEAGGQWGVAGGGGPEAGSWKDLRPPRLLSLLPGCWSRAASFLPALPP